MILHIISSIYQEITALRNELFNKGIFRAYSASIPVVSVGNLTVGGNGKTPLVLSIVKKLKERGLKPVVLSRGYGGSLRGPHLVADDDSPAEVGDEPLLVQGESGVPVVIARKRAKGAAYIESHKIGDIIILDDGFQHRWLNRNVDIICVDVSTEDAIEKFIKGEILPVGRFREDRDAALARAQIVVLIHRTLLDKVPPADQRILKIIPDTATVYRAFLKSGKLISTNNMPLPVSGTPLCIFSGIANPEGFEQSVLALGFKIAERKLYPDHHRFSEHDRSELEEIAQSMPLICTSKDYVKLKDQKIPNLFVLKAELVVTPEDAFVVHILRHAANVRAP